MRYHQATRVAAGLVLALAAQAPVRADVIFSDGLTHTVSTPILDQVQVSNATTVIFNAGGDVIPAPAATVNAVRVFDTSRVINNAGNLTAVSAGGTAAGLRALDDVQVSIFGGNLTATAGGGAFPMALGLAAENRPVVSIFGGSFTGTASGGFVGSLGLGLLADDQTVVSIHGGSFAGSFSGTGMTFGVGLVATGDSLVSVLGGQFQGTGSGPGAFDIATAENGTIILYGRDFSLPFGPVAAPAGVITGTLQDGTAVSLSFLRQDPTSQIILAGAVPEPSALALLGFGLVALVGGYWWRRGLA